MSSLIPKLFLSGILGLINGLSSYFILMDLPDAGRWALISGLFGFGLVLLILLLNDSRMARRYEKAEKSLPVAPHFRVGANMREGKKVASINVYLCGSEMILLDAHHREPVMIRITRDALRRAELTSSVQLTIETTDDRTILLLSPYMEELIRQLRKMGWFITENEE